MNNESERATFETWARNEFEIDAGIPLFREGKGYTGLAINAAWRAWRGAWQVRAASANDTGAEGAKLDKPAKVGGTRFGTGVKWSTVIGAAQRLYEYEVTPEKEAARIERARVVLDDIRNGKYASEPAMAAEAVVQWRTGEPAVEKGKTEEFILAVRRKQSNNRVFVFGATYANQFTDDGLLEGRDGDEFVADGWHLCGIDMGGEYNEVYEPIMLNDGDEILGWQPLPKWSDAAPQPAQADAREGLTDEQRMAIQHAADKLRTVWVNHTGDKESRELCHKLEALLNGANQ